MELCALEILVRNTRVGEMSTFPVGMTFFFFVCVSVGINEFKCELIIWTSSFFFF